ncbi:glycosyltransferase family 2 protein [Paenibacillus sp. MMS20-IR301]|uniref:glycosyltransferase family 2 protein n=1 Tax=Paenibacillus sp. MMS20-IR301 TaxID=2895946 RepID=UPI0028E37A36|nr:glycosyltransferase family 2 protein [Paenibacillus sp. MMS20-IR301]WNS43220.1 glycosyltransferase family 2 protein [Paenibacillus sp. MMS20-IR301]
MDKSAGLTLGVQLIVKNEAGLLPRCLASIDGADEVIVVDTGSTDHTLDIARTYGAAVYEIPWTHDFSAARNAGLSHAAADWILVLDADEVLHTPIGTIRSLLQNSGALAYTVRIENLLGYSPEDRLHHSSVRLFRNGQGFHFSGRIHESVDSSILHTHGSAAIHSSSIELIHTGYLPEIISSKNKLTRNEHLLCLALAEEPEDAFHSYNLAVNCCQNGRLQEAEELLRHSLNYAPLQISYRPSIIRDLCKIYLAAGKVKAIDSLLARELARYSDYPDLHFIQGQSWEMQGLWEHAYQAYQHAVDSAALTVPHRAYVSEHGMDSFRPLQRMGWIAQQLGQLEEAARLFHRSLQHHSVYPPALLGIASAFQQLEVPDENIAVLLQQLAGTEQGRARAAILCTLNEIGAHRVIAGLPSELYPLEAETLIIRLSSWIMTGQYPLFRQTAAGLRSNGLQLSTGALDAETARQLWLLEALCRWEHGEALPQEDELSVPAELRSGLLFIDQHLASKETASQAALTASGHAPLLTEIIRLAVKLEFVPLSKVIAAVFPACREDLAAVLYEEGWRAEAGELFIALVSSNQAPEAGTTLQYLGELLLDKGHYAEAAGWYRLLSGQESGSGAANAGLSLCYLQLARQALEEAIGSFKGAKVHGPLQEDLTATAHAITVLNRVPWHTSWNYRQRRRGAEPDL